MPCVCFIASPGDRPSVTGVVDRQAAILAARSYPAATTGAAVRITGEQRGARVVICVDGRLIEAHEGEMVAAALMAAGIYRLRQSPNAGTARGAFCLMGVCQECVIQVAGELRQSCMVSVVAGLEVETLPTTGEA